MMLDSDLAELYGMETRTLNQSVKRNIGRFPTDFMFQLTAEETQSLMFQFGISNAGRGGRRKPAYAFAEQGVAIMRAFVSLRGALIQDSDLARRILTLEQKYDEQFAVIFKAIRLLMEAPPVPERRMGFRAGNEETL